MPSQLLATKFYAPKPRRGLVSRPTLTERLLEGSHAKLVLISAPAGFGKSTVLAEWLAAPGDEVLTAWLSLDSGDDEPVTFWTHLIAALQTARAGTGASSLAMLEAQGQPIDSVLAPLLNELDALPAELILVLDDYHVIHSPEIHVGVTFVLEHLPDRVRLVIATRTDPPLPLARLRARGELLEIRASDLRFTPVEADAYFNRVMGLGLSSTEVAALEGRTEGWVAALQLAGLSMQGREDVAGFIAGFAGDDRYIVDYLVEEVLQRETEHVRAFLLHTSILARLSGPLCDAVTGQGGGQATLENLHRRNLFLIPLDDRRRWYRYHHLFGDVLQARLLAEDPGRVAALHRRASDWHERAGDRPEAIHHALVGQDFARAADLVELAIPQMNRDRQEATLRRWLEQIPDEIIWARPVLSDGYAGNILVRGETEGVEARLLDAERGLAATDAGALAEGDAAPAVRVADEVALRKLPASIAIHRAGLARLLGDVAGTIAHARRALELIGDDDHIGWASASALLGLAHWSNADLEAASDLYATSLARFEKVGFLADSLGMRISLADMQIARGRLRKASRIYEQGLELAVRPGGAVLRGAADMHVGMSVVLSERNDLAGAAEHLERARNLGDDNGLPQNPYRSRVAAASILQAKGDIDAANELLKEAERLYVTDFAPSVRPVAALRARLLIAQGNLPEARAWAHEHGLSPKDELKYEREFEHLTLARLMLAEASRDGGHGLVVDVLAFLERLLSAAAAGGRTGSVIDALLVQALAHQASDNRTAALAALTSAISLAEPEGYVRIFADEGPPMAALLKVAARQADPSGTAGRLLAAVVTPGATSPPQHALIEPLSERELEVLRLLNSDLGGPDIARELTLSLATVRTHTRNIYGKLGVNSRRAAVRRAVELGLFSRSAQRPPTV